MSNHRLVALVSLQLIVAGSATADEEVERWFTDELHFVISGHARMSPAAALKEAQAAADTWNREGLGPLIIIDEFASGTNAAQGDAVNAIRFVDRDWASDPSNLGSTARVIDRRHDEIVEADVRLNLDGYDLRVTPGDDAWDLQSVLVHELGHALGLSHIEDDPTATMFPNLRPGELHQRDLAAADVEALAQRYASDEVETAHGCAAVDLRTSAPAWLALLLAFTSGFRRRRE